MVCLLYHWLLSLQNTPSLLEVKDLEESSDGVAADKTHITVVVSDDMLCQYNPRRTPSVDKSRKRKSKTHRKVRRPSKIVDETLIDGTASKTVSGVNSSHSATSIDVAQDANSKDVQEHNMLSNHSIRNFPLLQLTNTNAVNQDDMKREFPGLVKSLQTFDNAAHRNKPFVSHRPMTQHPVPKTEYSTVPPHNHVPPYFKAMPFTAVPTTSHDPSNKVQGHMNMPQLFPCPFPLLNVTKDVKPTNHQSDFKFPLIPFKPFVPKLIKPNELTGHNKSDKPFPFLHCEHPSYQQARQGHPLLKLPEKEFQIENSKISQPIPSSKHHDMFNHSSSSSIPCGKLDSAPSSIKIKRHRKLQKSKPSNKPHFVESSVQTDASYRAPSPVTASVESSRDTKSAEKLVQTSPPQTPKSKTVNMASLPVFVQHQGLEMKRMEMRQSQKVIPTTAASVLQRTVVLDNINDNNIQVSDTIPSTTDSDTVNNGSHVEVTHTRVTPEHHASTVITDQDDQTSYKHTTSTVVTDQDDQSSYKHASTVVTDQDDQLSTEHNDDQEVTSSSHKQSFLNVMDIEGELVVNDDHKETTSISSTSGKLHVMQLVY